MGYIPVSIKKWPFRLVAALIFYGVVYEFRNPNPNWLLWGLGYSFAICALLYFWPNEHSKRPVSAAEWRSLPEPQRELADALLANGEPVTVADVEAWRADSKRAYRVAKRVQAVKAQREADALRESNLAAIAAQEAEAAVAKQRAGRL